MLFSFLFSSFAFLFDLSLYFSNTCSFFFCLPLRGKEPSVLHLLQTDCLSVHLLLLLCGGVNKNSQAPKIGPGTNLLRSSSGQLETLYFRFRFLAASQHAAYKL